MIKVLASIALVLLIVILVLVLWFGARICWRVKKAATMKKQAQKDFEDLLEELKGSVDRSLEGAMQSIAEEKIQASKRKNECVNREEGEESPNGLKAIEKELKKEINDVFFRPRD